MTNTATQADDDISFALAAKSDQLNAMDIMGHEPIITIREVAVKKSPDQPVWVYFNGDNNRPWKPSKGMLRILSAAWGTLARAWIGKSAQIFCNPDVIYGGKKVGGIQIRALSDIAQGMAFTLAINRGTRVPYRVERLDIAAHHQRPEYPQEEFKKRLPKMIEAMDSGAMTLQQVIAQCERNGRLTAEQIATLETVAPVEVTDDDQHEETTEE